MLELQRAPPTKPRLAGWGQAARNALKIMYANARFRLKCLEPARTAWQESRRRAATATSEAVEACCRFRLKGE